MEGRGLFPTLVEHATPLERAQFERTAAVSRFFGGAPREGGARAAAMKAPDLPKVAAPATPAGAAPARAKKKKEGC